MDSNIVVKISGNTMDIIKAIKEYKISNGYDTQYKQIIDTMFKEGKPEEIVANFPKPEWGKDGPNFPIKISQGTYNVIVQMKLKIEQDKGFKVYTKNIVDEMFKGKRPQKVFGKFK